MLPLSSCSHSTGVGHRARSAQRNEFVKAPGYQPREWRDEAVRKRHSIVVRIFVLLGNETAAPDACCICSFLPRESLAEDLFAMDMHSNAIYAIATSVLAVDADKVTANPNAPRKALLQEKVNQSVPTRHYVAVTQNKALFDFLFDMC